MQTPPAVPSIIVICTVIIFFTTKTIAFPQPIYVLPDFIETYRPIQSAYHPLTSRFSQSGIPPGSSGMPYCWTTWQITSVVIISWIWRQRSHGLCRSCRLLCLQGGGSDLTCVFRIRGKWGPQTNEPPSPLLLLGNHYKLEREREWLCFWRGGGGV